MQNELLKDKGLIVSASIFSLALAAGYFFDSKQKKEGEKSEAAVDLQQQELLINKQLDNLNSLQAILSEKAEEIELEYLKNAPHILTPASLRQIFEFTQFVIDAADVQNCYDNSRKARRSCFNLLKNKLGVGPSPQLEIYYRFVCTFEEQIQYLIEKSQKDFVVFLNIDYGVITDSVDFHMNQPETGFSNWFRDWALQIREQLKEKLVLNEFTVSYDTILEIVKYQVDLLGREVENFKRAIEDLQLESEEERESVPAFVEAYLEDLTFQIYGVEIEQINLKPNEIDDEMSERLLILKEFKAVFKNIQTKQISLESEEGSFQDFNEDYLQN